jgi:hypothetical protein
MTPLSLLGQHQLINHFLIKLNFVILRLFNYWTLFTLLTLINILSRLNLFISPIIKFLDLGYSKWA